MYTFINIKIKFIIDNEHTDISSSNIRKLIYENRITDIEKLVPDEIYKKISKKY